MQERDCRDWQHKMDIFLLTLARERCVLVYEGDAESDGAEGEVECSLRHHTLLVA